MTNQRKPAGEYPPLPEPRHRGPAATGSYFDAFTADQMRAYVDADRAMRVQAAPTPSEWDVRGRLAASLTCWHRLTGQEADELVALFQGHPAQAAPAAVAGPSNSEIDALVASIGPTEGIRRDSRDLTMDKLRVLVRRTLATWGHVNTAPAAQKDAEDAARYRCIRRGQHWSVIDGIGNELRAEALDTAIDAALKQGANHD